MMPMFDFEDRKAHLILIPETKGGLQGIGRDEDVQTAHKDLRHEKCKSICFFITVIGSSGAYFDFYLLWV